MSKDLFVLVKNTVDIVDVIGHYIPLTKIGNYFKGLSPFKNEKTPSFTVTPEKKIFYCFSTHVGGDVIDFVSRVEHCSQYEAACILIERYRIPVEKNALSGAKQEHEEENTYFKAHRLFSEFCKEKLQKNNEALIYLESRGITVESIEKFKLGYCSADSSTISAFFEILFRQGILKKDIQKTHIFSETKTKRIFFIPEKRIIFPVSNQINIPCGYGARIFQKGDNRAKYVNSTNSAAFSKKNLLYNFFNAKNTLRLTKEIFFVEGFLDVILMDQSGYPNTVATMGTAPTLHHIELVKKFVNTIIIMYDGDSAGRAAILKFINLCWNEEIDVQVVILPANEDPASLAQKNKLKEQIEKRISAIDFFLNEKKELIKKSSLKDISHTLTDIFLVLQNITDKKRQAALKLKIASELGIDPQAIEYGLQDKKNTDETKQVAIKTEEKKDQRSEEWYLFFHLTLFFYDPLNEKIKKALFLLQFVVGEKLARFLKEFQENYQISEEQYLDFLKKRHEKLYMQAVKMINQYSFTKEQYTIIFNKIVQLSWVHFHTLYPTKKFAEFMQFLDENN